MLRKITPEGVLKEGLVASLLEDVEITDCTVYDATLGYAVLTPDNGVHFVGRFLCNLPYSVYINRDSNIDRNPWSANSVFIGLADKGYDMSRISAVFTKQEVLDICNRCGIATDTYDDQYSALLRFWWTLVQQHTPAQPSPREFIYALVMNEKNTYYKSVVKVHWLN